MKENNKLGVRDVVTSHNRFANKTWIEAFLDLDRGEETLELYFNNPRYYDELKKIENCDLSLACKVCVVQDNEGV